MCATISQIFFCLELKVEKKRNIFLTSIFFNKYACGTKINSPEIPLKFFKKPQDLCLLSTISGKIMKKCMFLTFSHKNFKKAKQGCKYSPLPARVAGPILQRLDKNNNSNINNKVTCRLRGTTWLADQKSKFTLLQTTTTLGE